MASTIIKTNQKVLASLNPKDANGFPTSVFNLSWAVVANTDGQTGDCTVVPSDDGLSCMVMAGAMTIPSTIRAAATKKPDPNSELISEDGVVGVEQVIGEASTLGMSFGEPMDK